MRPPPPPPLSPFSHPAIVYLRPSFSAGGDNATHVDLEETLNDPTLKPAFVVTMNVGYYAMLSYREMRHLDGRIDSSFSASITSTGVNQESLGKTLIGLTFASYDVPVYSEYIAYNWLALLGSIGGTAAFATVVHSLSVACAEAVFGSCCACVRTPKHDEEDEAEESGKPSEAARQALMLDHPF